MSKNSIKPYLFIAPVILVLLTHIYFSLPYSMFLAVTKMELGTGKLSFTGLDNFKTIFTSNNFWESTEVTLKYAFFSTVILLVLSFFLALVFNNKFKLRSFYLTVLLIPWLISEVVTGLMWSWLFNGSYGLLNYIFSPIGIRPSDLLSQGKIAFFAISIVTIWQWASYATLMILAGLQNISKDVMEAARIDGAAAFQSLVRIILPLMKSTLMVVGLLVLIWSMGTTGLIMVMTQGGPVRATTTLSLYIYKQAFFYMNFPEASAISIALAAINSVFAVLYTIVSKKTY